MWPSFNAGQALTPAARTYALQELARRAGVAREFFATWRVEVQPARTVVALGNENRTVCFEHCPDSVLSSLLSGKLPIARAPWPSPSRHELLQERLVLPFVKSSTAEVPLFLPREDGITVCQLDVLMATLFTLSRAEELIHRVSDIHGRFPASASLAVQHGFLERPIVDEYGLAFAKVLQALLPRWEPAPRTLRVKLTHDIDGVGIPFELRAAVGHTLKRRRPSATLRDLASSFTQSESTELDLVRQLARISKSRGLHSTFFWKASPPSAHDSGYDPSHPKIQRVIAELREEGFEHGVHPGYDTFTNREGLEQEVFRLRRVLGADRLGGRQHYLRWNPRTWLDWEACGLSYDSTVGFADAIGFRAGTSIPFRPWSLEENRELDLIEVPLVVMDCTPVKYMGLARREGLQRIKYCMQRTALAGGVFTLLWHNMPLIDPEYNGWYDSVLDLLPASVQSYRLPASPAELW